MNERDLESLIAAARALADRLDAEGSKDAGALVRRLANSRVQARETNRRLYADNLALRTRAAE